MLYVENEVVTVILSVLTFSFLVIRVFPADQPYVNVIDVANKEWKVKAWVYGVGCIQKEA